MATLQEWISGFDSNGNALDPVKVQKYRRLQNRTGLDGGTYKAVATLTPGAAIDAARQHNAAAANLDYQLIRIPEVKRRRHRDYGEGCQHRGGLVAVRTCNVCSSPGPLRILNCSLHGQCSERSPAPSGVTSCETCPESPFARSGEDAAVDLRHKVPVAVIITAHNHAAQGWLMEAIQSVLRQTVRVAEIIVVDDASTDDCAGVCATVADKVRYIRVEHQNTHATRMTGLAASHSQVICFLDADDWLGETYIDEAVAKLEELPQVGVIYSDCVKHFQDGTEQPWVLEATDINQQNYMHAGSVVRRDALLGSGIHERSVSMNTLEDWAIWRAILRDGWKSSKSPAIYHYRKHDGSKMSTIYQGSSYRVRANLDAERVTVAFVLSGRPMWWERLRQWLEKQTWPKEQTCIHLMVNCHKSWDWHRELTAQVIEAGYTDFRLQRIPSKEPQGRNIADMDRYDQAVFEQVQAIMPRLYNRVIQSVDTEYLLTIEDDVLPPADVISRLMDSMAEDVAAVTGVVPGRYKDQGFLAWRNGKGDYRTIAELGRGVEQIAGSGFGCCLHRASIMKQIPLHSGPPTGNFDQAYFDSVSYTQRRILIDWSIQCLHQNLNCGTLPPGSEPT